jgi:hypothetical protein
MLTSGLERFTILGEFGIKPGPPLLISYSYSGQQGDSQ